MGRRAARALRDDGVLIDMQDTVEHLRSRARKLRQEGELASDEAKDLLGQAAEQLERFRTCERRASDCDEAIAKLVGP